MNPQDPLAALHPLREPAAITWWPLAPGWWLLIVLILIALLALAIVLLRRHRKNAYRRQSLKQLDEIHGQYLEALDKNQPTQSALPRLNALLKATALHAFPRHDVAALSGDGWLEFLNTSIPNTSSDPRFPSSFAQASYRQDITELDTEEVFRAARNWISTHRASR